jgi:hypothetical protein
MVFQPGVTMGKKSKSEDAAHDDETQDRALIKRMLQQHDTKHGDQSASADTKSLKRQVRDLQASVELLTDTMKKMTGLITDGTFPRALVTDARSRLARAKSGWTSGARIALLLMAK